MHTSFFSYNLTKPFPFKWFTPFAIVGGVVFSALFTFLNFASSGYDLIVQTSSEPNATVAHEAWLHHWPSFLTTKLQPTCQPADIPVGTQIFTNQTALTYTLEAVWTQADDGVRRISPSVTYHNNALRDCAITSVELDLISLDRSTNQFAYTEWGVKVRTYVGCRISASLGWVYLNLTQAYEYVPDDITISGLHHFLATEFLSRDVSSRASLWWGESLMSNYGVYRVGLMQDERQNATDHGQNGIRKGTMYFTPGDQSIDIQDLSFFNLNYRFLVDQGGGNYDVYSGGEQNTKPIGTLVQERTYPNTWIAADSLVKSTYSVVLSDLGQVEAKPNILTDASLLQYFTSNFSLATQYAANAERGPSASQVFDARAGLTTAALFLWEAIGQALR